jgi:hypothetical protein
MTLPVVVTKSMFQDTPFLFIGMAPPPLERNEAASRMSCMSSNGALVMSAFDSGSPGPLFSRPTPVLTSSTWPSSSAVMLATRL